MAVRRVVVWWCGGVVVSEKRRCDGVVVGTFMNMRTMWRVGGRSIDEPRMAIVVHVDAAESIASDRRGR